LSRRATEWLNYHVADKTGWRRRLDNVEREKLNPPPQLSASDQLMDDDAPSGGQRQPQDRVNEKPAAGSPINPGDDELELARAMQLEIALANALHRLATESDT
jgi:hypothetical protein